jgi:hypothetical protein
MTYQLGSIDPDEHGYPMHTAGPGQALPPRGRGLLISALALGVMAVFAAGLWFAYVQGTRHGRGGDGDVPLIRADEHPTRVKPDQPGGMEIPDRDMLIYQKPSRAVVERLLPPPEKPMPRPAPPPVAPAPAPEPAALAAASPPPAPEPPAPQQAAGPVPPSPAPPGPAPGKPADTIAAKPLPAAAGGVRLQLGALRSEDVAQREWQKIKAANADLVGKLSATTVRADLADKGVVYRIQTAPISDPIAGALLCDELKQRHIGCVIAR